jgi:hypothetical protein
MEVPDYTAKEIARRMNPARFLIAATALAAALMVAFFNVAPTQGQTSSGDAHQGQIYGTVQTGNMAAGNQIRLDDVTIVVRNAKGGKLGKIVGFSPIKDGQYTVDMGGLPAGNYVVVVDPGASGYMQGETRIEYPGRDGSKKQNWTVSTGNPAIPSLDLGLIDASGQ